MGDRKLLPRNIVSYRKMSTRPDVYSMSPMEVISADDPQSLFPGTEYCVFPRMQYFLSTTKDIEIARKFAETRGHDGIHHKGKIPEGAHWIPWRHQYSLPDWLPDPRKQLDQDWYVAFKAREMEEKWDCYYSRTEDCLYVARSWSDILVGKVQLEPMEAGDTTRSVVKTAGIYTKGKGPSTEEFDKRLSDWFIVTYFLQLPYYPVPLDQEIPPDVCELSVYSTFGHHAKYGLKPNVKLPWNTYLAFIQSEKEKALNALNNQKND